MASHAMTTPGQMLRDPATRRMGVFIITSFVAHLVLIGAIGSTALRQQQAPLILQAQLRTVTPDTRPALAIEGESPQIDPPASVPDNRVVEVQPSTVQHPVDTQRILNLPADTYYASNEVDIRAEPLEDVNLIYPVLPLQQRVAGSVTLNIFVNERGGIDKTVVVESKPPGVFDEAALQAVAELKFSPAIKNGKPVKNRKTIAVNFDPYEKINTP
jgi:TonB family protein